MGITLAGARTMGTPFPAHLSEYMRTIIYRVPGFIVREGDLIPIFVKDTADFRASIVTDPLSYLREDDFSDQYNLDASFPDALREQCGIDASQSEKHIFVVIQFKQDMCSFAAVEGQCIKREHRGTEVLFIVDCDDAPTPRPDERRRSKNAALTAVKMEFEVTTALDTVFDRRCYKTDDDKCLYKCSPNLRGALTVEIPLSVKDIVAKSKNCQTLARKIEESIENGRVGGQQGRDPDSAKRLEELIDALQLEPSTDDSYLRLWFLQLCHRAEEFGKTCKWQFRNKQKAVRVHRDNIAHSGVDRVDIDLLQAFQKNLFRVIISRL